MRARLALVHVLAPRHVGGVPEAAARALLEHALEGARHVAAPRALGDGGAGGGRRRALVHVHALHGRPRGVEAVLVPRVAHALVAAHRVAAGAVRGAAVAARRALVLVLDHRAHAEAALLLHPVPALHHRPNLRPVRLAHRHVPREQLRLGRQRELDHAVAHLVLAQKQAHALGHALLQARQRDRLVLLEPNQAALAGALRDRLAGLVSRILAAARAARAAGAAREGHQPKHGECRKGRCACVHVPRRSDRVSGGAAAALFPITVRNGSLDSMRPLPAAAGVASSCSWTYSR